MRYLLYAFLYLRSLVLRVFVIVRSFEIRLGHHGQQRFPWRYDPLWLGDEEMQMVSLVEGINELCRESCEGCMAGERM